MICWEIFGNGVMTYMMRPFMDHTGFLEEEDGVTGKEVLWQQIDEEAIHLLLRSMI